jgi:DNA-binding GntR family transcriptional regulator
MSDAELSDGEIFHLRDTPRGSKLVARIMRARRDPLRTTPKRGQVSRGIRAAILRGDYADGLALSQDKLAAEYGVNREVVWHVLAALERAGHVSSDERNRFHVNATYVSHQLQLMLNKLDHVERLASRTIVLLGADPHDP